MTGTDKDMVVMFEDAYKQQPTNEELGAQTFFANVRGSNWKSAQQVWRSTSSHLYPLFIQAFGERPWLCVSLKLLEFGITRCFAKDASQVATRMYKQFQEDRYLYWSVLSAVLQVWSALSGISTFPDYRMQGQGSGNIR